MRASRRIVCASSAWRPCPCPSACRRATKPRRSPLTSATTGPVPKTPPHCFSTSAANAGKDGGCFAGEPLWAFGQAAAALIGTVAAFAAPLHFKGAPRLALVRRRATRRSGAPRPGSASSRLRECYIRRMTEIAARDLRNRTADVLRRVAAGEPVTITSRGRPVAELIPVREQRRRPIARAELARRLAVAQADAGLLDELAVLAGETTDDLGPIR